MDKRRMGIVLLSIAVALAGAVSVGAQEIGIDVTTATPWLLAGEDHVTHLKVSLTGFSLAEQEERTPVNIAIVLDRSGSMDGEKIAYARDAAKMAIDLLESHDIVSIVTYSDTVSVLMPATRVSDKRYIRNRIDEIYADGSTALFAGVSKGAQEVSKFFDDNKVNRVILLSDGLANVGPDSPAALGDLGASLGKSGISVTTIGLGLGFNEDLMVRLAEKSDGNHAFVENSRDLARIFEYEFGDILSVVAQDVEIEIRCATGVRPLRVLGREADIVGQRVYTTLNQLYSEQEKYILLEVSVDSHEEATDIPLAEISLSYNNMVSQRVNRFSDIINIGFTARRDQVEKSIDVSVMESAILQIATEQSDEAVRLRDEGRVEEAKSAMQATSTFLQSNAAKFESEELAGYGAAMAEDAESIEDEDDWNATRKKMVDDQYENRSQQSY